MGSRFFAFAFAGIAEFGRRGLVVDLNMPLDMAEGLVAACPSTRFVVEHLGGAQVRNKTAAAFSTWSKWLRRLSAHTNIECIQLGGVMSAFGASGQVDKAATKTWVREALTIFGFGRVCFEGNWFFNNWGGAHANLQVYGLWASILQEIFTDMKASKVQIITSRG